MEEYERYFGKYHFNSWSDILGNEKTDICSNTSEANDQNVQLLPRKDVSIYGIIPMFEGRFFSSCKECKRVFNPKDVLLHKNCSLKIKSQPETSTTKKGVKSKKSDSRLPPPPLFHSGPETVSQLEELNTKELSPSPIYIVNVNELPPIDADVSPILPKPSHRPEAVGDIPLPSTINSHMAQDEPSTHEKPITNTANKSSSKSDSNSNVHSKSKKKKNSNGLVLDTKGPSTRSIECSNHNSENVGMHQKKKSLNLDSTDFSQESSDANSVSYKPTNRPVQPGHDDVASKDDSTIEILHQNSIYFVNMNTVPTIAAPDTPSPLKCSLRTSVTGDISLQISSTYTDENEKLTNSPVDKTSSKSNSNIHIKSKKMKFSKQEKPDPNTHSGLGANSKGPSTRSIKYSSHSGDNNGFLNQSQSLNLDGTDSVVYSPSTPLETLGAEEKMCLDSTPQALTATECSHSIYFTIPDQLSIKMHETRPKLASVPLYGARNIGGAITISKQTLVDQRMDILAAINSKHKANDIILS